MGKNLKQRFEEDRLLNHHRRPDHEDLFTERLYTELPNKKRRLTWRLKVAASVLLLIGASMTFYMLGDSQTQAHTPFSLGQVSSDLMEIESFYTSNIKLELSTIASLSETQKDQIEQALTQRYMRRFKLLKGENEKLIAEINAEGPSSRNISALIDNLRFQLELLQELRAQLTTLKHQQYEQS